ncbi:hypothetical protein HYG86_11400 [Alkalicella caledoniensis]|uniref:RNA polymerase sigma-70 region 2 domain-containing protein n=1 Tax=Alkalicella caledoniensis TaxID=2731377 RepID=A0A7G9W9G6_ALKCA|nr:sigma factor [Alkalicella caledoniensis]QNO15328.1 hypothetical protein HYG86_11400 [Alkalicella caledoniensis]
MDVLQRKEDDKRLKKLITAYKNGNQIALVEIFEFCEGMVERMSTKYYSIAIKRSMSIEDLKQEAYLGLLGAVNHFKVCKDNSFISYAFSAMNYQILVYIRNNSNQFVKTDVKKGFASLSSMDEALNGETDTTLGEMLPDECSEDEFHEIEKLVDNEILKKDIQMMLEDVIASDAEIALMKDIYGLDGETYSLNEICEKHNLTLKELVFKERLMVMQIRNCGKLENYLEKFDYHCKEAYKYGVQRFKDTRVSSTEYVAFMNMEGQEDLRRKVVNEE